MLNNRKIRIILIFSIIAVLAFVILNGRSDEVIEENLEPEQVYGKVVVSTQDLIAREVITDEMVTEIDYPVELIHPNAAKTKDQVVGLIPVHEVSIGDILMTNEIVSKENGGLTFKLEKDEVSKTVPVSEINAGAGLIQVGDEVNVLGLFDDSLVGEKLSEFTLADLRVIAIGKEMTEGAIVKEGENYSTITLALQPEQAIILSWAENWGSIELLPKSAYNNEISDLVDGVTAETLFGKYDSFKTKQYISELKERIEIQELVDKANENK